MVYRSSRRAEGKLFDARLIKIVSDHEELYARRIAELMFPFSDIHGCSMEYARTENALRRLVKQGKLQSELREDISFERGGKIRRRWYKANGP